MKRLILAAVVLAAPCATAAAQQSELTVSPFVTLLPATGASPLAGLAFTLAGTSGLALRASGHLSLENGNTSSLDATNSLRPWGGDADAVLFIGGRYLGRARALAPYTFAGVGLSGRDSLGASLTRTNWSYGAGLQVPLGGQVDLFGESRWRMSRFVLPTAANAPSPAQEFRVGLSFHIGGSGLSASRSTHPSSRICSEQH